MQEYFWRQIETYRDLLRKREADEPEELPESKKPRFAEGNDTVTMEDEADVPNTTPVIAEDDKAAAVEVAEQDSVTTAVPAAKGKKEKKSKDSGGVNSYKEHPFTFLAPGDPVLLNCMSALFFAQSCYFIV